VDIPEVNETHLNTRYAFTVCSVFSSSGVAKFLRDGQLGALQFAAHII
jgi:hypothetical protein